MKDLEIRKVWVKLKMPRRGVGYALECMKLVFVGETWAGERHLGVLNI